MPKTPEKSRQSVMMIPLSMLSENPDNPRTLFDELDGLAESIRNVGILNPLLVGKKAGGYQILAGHRRFRAAQIAELDPVPCTILPQGTDVAAVMLIEQLHHEGWHPLDEAAAYSKLMRDEGLSAAQVGELIGKSADHVYQSLKLFELSPEAKAFWERNPGLHPTSAVKIARLDPVHQIGACEAASQMSVSRFNDWLDGKNLRPKADKQKQEKAIVESVPEKPKYPADCDPTLKPSEPVVIVVAEDRYEEIRKAYCADKIDPGKPARVPVLDVNGVSYVNVGISGGDCHLVRAFVNSECPYPPSTELNPEKGYAGIWVKNGSGTIYRLGGRPDEITIRKAETPKAPEPVTETVPTPDPVPGSSIPVVGESELWQFVDDLAWKSWTESQARHRAQTLLAKRDGTALPTWTPEGIPAEPTSIEPTPEPEKPKAIRTTKPKHEVPSPKTESPVLQVVEGGEQEPGVQVAVEEPGSPPCDEPPSTSEADPDFFDEPVIESTPAYDAKKDPDSPFYEGTEDLGDVEDCREGIEDYCRYAAGERSFIAQFGNGVLTIYELANKGPHEPAGEWGYRLLIPSEVPLHSRIEHRQEFGTAESAFDWCDNWHEKAKALAK